MLTLGERVDFYLFLVLHFNQHSCFTWKWVQENQDLRTLVKTKRRKKNKKLGMTVPIATLKFVLSLANVPKLRTEWSHTIFSLKNEIQLFEIKYFVWIYRNELHIPSERLLDTLHTFSWFFFKKTKFPPPFIVLITASSYFVLFYFTI